MGPVWDHHHEERPQLRAFRPAPGVGLEPCRGGGGGLCAPMFAALSCAQFGTRDGKVMPEVMSRLANAASTTSRSPGFGQ